MQVQVIATTEEGTLAALVEAKHLARRIDIARVVMMVPRIGAGQTVAGCVKGDDEIVDDYRLMARQTGVDVIVRLCLCGGYDEMFRRMMPWKSMVVIGGRRRWWWPTREQRLADQLKRIGHETVFAEASRSVRSTE